MKVLAAIAFAVVAVLGSWNSYELLQANRTIADQSAAIASDSTQITEQAAKIAALTTSQATADPNVYTAAIAKAFCAQDAQGVYDALANGSTIKDSLKSESDYYAQIVDNDTAGAAALIAEAGQASGTDVSALLAALDAKAATIKAANSPVAILASEIKLAEGTTCAMTFKGSFVDRYGSYAAIYVVTYLRADGSSDANFYVFTAGNGGVEDIQ